MRYVELKQKHSDELNSFPMAFAFSNEQFKKGLDKLGATEKEVCSIPGGGFIRKSDSKALIDLMVRHDNEMKEAMANDQDGKGFLLQAFSYELNNHEYCITGESEDALSALGLTEEEVLSNKIMAGAFKQAKKYNR